VFFAHAPSLARCHFAVERGDNDGNLHFHIVIKLRCNVTDKAELLNCCKSKCGIVGSTAGANKWSVQHLETKKGKLTHMRLAGEEQRRKRASCRAE